MSQLFEIFPDLPGGISAMNGDPIYVLEGSLDRLTPGLISSGSFLMSAILNNFLSLVHLFRERSSATVEASSLIESRISLVKPYISKS